MQRVLLSLFVAGFAATEVIPACSDELVVQAPIELRGEVDEPKDISAIETVGEYLIVGSDETTGIQILEQDDANALRVKSTIELAPSDGNEIDIEAVAAEGRMVYVIGSHSLKRKKLDPEKKYRTNRRRLTEVEHEESRDRLLRFRLGDDGTADGSVEHLKLRKLLKSDEVLGRFASIPSKENGIDIEGLAVKHSTLFIGFRGPVLRGNYVPVLVLNFDAPKKYEARYVDLGGRGIRSLCQVHGGFLILAGPVGDGPGSFQIYFWNGDDVIPGDDRTTVPARLLATVPVDGDSKAEGLAVSRETAEEFTLLLAFDGVKARQIVRARLIKD